MFGRLVRPRAHCGVRSPISINWIPLPSRMIHTKNFTIHSVMTVCEEVENVKYLRTTNDDIRRRVTIVQNLEVRRFIECLWQQNNVFCHPYVNITLSANTDSNGLYNRPINRWIPLFMVCKLIKLSHLSLCFLYMWS